MFTRWTLDVSNVLAGGIICSDFKLMCPLISECHHMRCAYGHLINASRAFKLFTLKVTNQLQWFDFIIAYLDQQGQFLMLRLQTKRFWMFLSEFIFYTWNMTKGGRSPRKSEDKSDKQKSIRYLDTFQLISQSWYVFFSPTLRVLGLLITHNIYVSAMDK